MKYFIKTVYSDFYWKFWYICIFYCILWLFFYMNCEWLLKFLNIYYKTFLVIRDVQDLVMIYTVISFFASNVVCIFFFIFNIKLWLCNLLTKRETIIMNIFIISFIYDLFYSFWLMRQDVFTSTWDLLFKGYITNWYDLQPDFYIFFMNNIDDLIFLIFILIFCNYFLLIFLIKMTMVVKILFLRRFLLFFIFSLFIVYFLDLRFWYFITIFFYVEFFSWLFLFFFELKKLILKNDYNL